MKQRHIALLCQSEMGGMSPTLYDNIFFHNEMPRRIPRLDEFTDPSHAPTRKAIEQYFGLYVFQGLDEQAAEKLPTMKGAESWCLRYGDQRHGLVYINRASFSRAVQDTPRESDGHPGMWYPVVYAPNPDNPTTQIAFVCPKLVVCHNKAWWAHSSRLRDLVHDISPGISMPGSYMGSDAGSPPGTPPSETHQEANTNTQTGLDSLNGDSPPGGALDAVPTQTDHDRTTQTDHDALNGDGTPGGTLDAVPSETDHDGNPQDDRDALNGDGTLGGILDAVPPETAWTPGGILGGEANHGATTQTDQDALNGGSFFFMSATLGTLFEMD